MKGSRRDIIIGAVILLLVLAGIYLIRRPRVNSSTPTPTPISQFEQRVGNEFNIQIPDNVERIDLKDSKGEVTGIATRIYENGQYVATVLADLPDPQPGYFYQAWAYKSDSEFISLGTLRLAKGGYLVEYTSTTNYPDHKKVVVTLERVRDNKPETKVLESSF